MKNSFLTLFFILLYSCRHTPSNSSIKEILSKEGPSWHLISDKKPHQYTQNIFAISFRNKIRGSGFVLGKNKNLIITNAHVVILWKEMCKTNCPMLLGLNSFNAIEITKFYKTPEFDGIDKELDLAILQFNWLEKKKELVDIPLKKEIPLIEEKISLLGFASLESDFVLSKGKVQTLNFKDTKKPYFSYNADTVPGMSGSPVFNELNELVGIHFGHPKGAKYNRAIPIRLIFDRYGHLF